MPKPADGNSEVSPIFIETAKTTTLQDAMENLRENRVVYVGETHTSLSDHELQLEVLKAMVAQGGPLAVGVEWFQRPFQKVLDRYVAGEIDEHQMLRETEYFQRWGFDYRLYRDILRFARDNSIPVLALNASRELTDEIRKHGLDALPDAIQAQKPDGYDFDDQQYAEYLKGVFEQHIPRMRGPDDPDAFQRFLQVQLTWDESMAQTAADYLKDNPEARLLVLAGRGHTHNAAIPRRLTRRTDLVGVSIGTYEPNSPFDKPDYMVLQKERRLPPQGLIGVGLAERDEGVVITSISAGSHAKEAGVRVGDRVVMVDDTKIEDYLDIKLSMMNRLPGETLRLKLTRDGWFGGGREVDAKVKLIARGGMQP